MPGTLARRLADADDERFVGRRQELRFFDRLLAPHTGDDGVLDAERRSCFAPLADGEAGQTECRLT